MPKELPPGSPVTIQQLNPDSWLITRQNEKKIVLVAFPVIDELPSDPDWEAVELLMAKHNTRKLPPFEE